MIEQDVKREKNIKRGMAMKREEPIGDKIHSLWIKLEKELGRKPTVLEVYRAQKV